MEWVGMIGKPYFQKRNEKTSSIKNGFSRYVWLLG
jgi:hypothetical protein